MRKLLLALAVCGGCVPMAAPKSEGIRSTIDVAPKTPPTLAGGYDFDLLDAVEGTSCVSASDVDVYTATIPGFEPTKGSLLDQRAEGAALYDAMGKAQGADTLLVTWVKIVAQGDKKCATVHARGVRLRQHKPAEAPTATPPAAPAPAPASGEAKPSTAAAAIPSS